MATKKTTGKQLADLMYGGDQIRATPQSRITGPVANAVRKAQQFASQYEIDPRIPLLGGTGVDELLSLPDAASLLEDVSYNGMGALVRGGNAATGGLGTFRPDPRIVSAADVAATATGVGKLGALAARAAPGAVRAGVRNLSTPRTLNPQAGAVRVGPLSAPQEKALRLARERAKAVGQSEDPRTRMLQQGYEDDWYHGSTGDISRFRPDLLGETTGAQSAKKGFFFARDPQNPPEAMLKKSNDPAAGDLLRKMGISEEEIAKLNTVSMEGHGPETASGYALIGGSREYKEAMRKAKAAESRGDWPEYERQMQIAEDSETTRMQYGQGLVAKYGDARDEMLEGIKNVWYGPQNSERFKNMSQADYEAYDKKFKELMPYGWYNSYSNPQLEGLKKELVETVGEKAAEKVLGKINKFQSVRNERALIEKTQEGGNVMPVALRYENPMVYNFEGRPYRDQSYSDLVDQAQMAGNDALILKNTYDPGGGPSRLVDVGVVFDPDQVRSRFAAFDPLRKTAATAAAAGLAAPDLLAEEAPSRPIHFSDNPDVMQLELAGGGAVRMQAGGIPKRLIDAGTKAFKALKPEKEAAVPLTLPRVRPTTQDIMEAAERVGKQQAGEFVRSPLLKDTTNLAGRSKKEVERLKKLQYKVTPIKNLPEVKPYEARVGEVNIVLPGDQTISDMLLESVDDVPIGTTSEGGALFGRGRLADPEDTRAFWSSNIGPAEQFQKKVTELAELYDTDMVTAYHLAMGQMSNNFAQHMADASMRAIDYSKLNKNKMNAFDRVVSMGYVDPKTKERVTFENWPGIADPEASLQAMKEDPKLRKWFVNRMKTEKVTKPLDLPYGKSIEYAMTEPELRNMEINLTGLSAGRMKPGAELIPDSAHQTYSHDIPGTALGRAPELSPFSISFPDATAFVREKYRPQDFTGTIQKVFPHQVVDEAYLEDMYKYYTQLRKVRGFNEGGAVRKFEGGEITADDLILEERKL